MFVVMKAGDLNVADLGSNVYLRSEDNEIIVRVCLGLTVDMISTGKIGLVLKDEGLADRSFTQSVDYDDIVVVVR